MTSKERIAVTMLGGTPEENFCAFVEAGLRYGSYARD